MTRHQRLVLVLAVALMLLAAWTRFSGLGVQSLWNDEGSSYGQSLRTLPEIAVHAAADIHPPGYYALLAAWRVLTGESEFALRSLSVLASLLSAAAAFAIGKRLYGDTAGLAALAVVAVSTFSITYAQETRMYSLLALWGAASTWALLELIVSPGRRTALALAAATAAGLYTHYAYTGVLAAQAVFAALWLIWAIGSACPALPVVRAAIVGYGLAFVLYLPWLPTAARQVSQWGSTGEPIPLSEALPVAFGWLTVGPTFPVGAVPVAIPLLIILGFYHLPSRNAAGELRLPRPLSMALPLLWVALTLGGFLWFELFREANLKFLIPAQIAVALWIGRGAWVLWHLPLRSSRRWMLLAPKAATLLMIASILLGARAGIAALRTDPEYMRDDYRAIARAIAADGQPDAAVILNAPGQVEAFGYYARRYGPGWTLVPLPVGLTVDETATRDELDGLLANHRRIYAVLWGTDERDPDRIVESVLATRAYPIDENWYGDVRLARFVTPGDLGEPVRLGARFEYPGGALELVDYALSSAELAAGGSIEIALNWRATASVRQNYKVTVQLLDADGVLVAQRDAEPVGYQRPTSTWNPGEIVEDRHALVIPNALTSPQYRLIVGVYDPLQSTGRLLVDGRDAITLVEFAAQSQEIDRP